VTCSTITNKKAAERTRSGSLQSILKRAVYVRVPKTGSVLGVALFGSLIGQENTFLFGLRAALIISAALLVGAAGICSFALRGRQVARADHFLAAMKISRGASGPGFLRAIGRKSRSSEELTRRSRN
jgi:hypothetical protein